MKLKSMIYSLTALCTMAGFATAAESDTFKDPISKVNFPTTIEIDVDGKETTLIATGSDTRKKFFAKVYAVAHYMEDPKKGSPDEVLAEVMQDGKAKQLTLEWLRSITRNKFRGAIVDALQRNSSADEMTAIQEPMNEFIAAFSKDIMDGDTHEIRWLPGGELVIFINGKKAAEISNKKFAEAIWKIWLGPDSVVDENKLVSRITE